MRSLNTALSWMAGGVALASLALFAAPARASVDCEGLEAVGLAHAMVTSAAIETVDGVAVCRIAVTSRPTATSEIRIELWIPQGAAWNGKFVQVGNGGLAGAVPVNALRAVAAAGYAAAGTDGGHQGPTGDWLADPERWRDFAWRQLKETTDVSKALILTHRGAPAAYAFFAGCSEGGREAMMEALRFPNDFDGIIAGAPANSWSHLIAWYAQVQRALARPGGWLEDAQLALLQRSALAACGGGAYVLDAECRFDPATLACGPGETRECLTPAQIATASAFYDGWRRDGAAYPGVTPGAEADGGNWRFHIAADPARQAFAGTFFGSNAVYSNPVTGTAGVDVLTMTDAQWVDAIARNGAIMDASDPDLSAFRASGGKLLQFHGVADSAIPAAGSIAYFDAVRAAIGPEVGDFYRLYMAPGMFHCSGGVGPFGVDWLAILDRWVTQGATPDAVVAETEAGSPFILGPFQVLCPYPARADGPERDARCLAPGQPET